LDLFVVEDLHILSFDAAWQKAHSKIFSAHAVIFLESVQYNCKERSGKVG
jgi:hypothetical protein